MKAACFHCGEPLYDSTFTARISGKDEPVCCAGCRAVAELIATSGLEDFYQYRSGASLRPDAATLATSSWAAYSRPEIAAQFIRSAGAADSVTVAVDGLRCAACSWLLDRGLRNLPGVATASTNAATGRVHVVWDRSRLDLATLLHFIAQLGYRPHLLNEGDTDRLQRREYRDALKRLALSGFGMMQVMMFAVAIYAAEIAGETMDAGLLKFFKIVSLLVATPVLFYAGAPILAGAWNSLRRRAIGMDVPVGIALVLAYGASVWNTLSASTSAVYFDSVTMFVFFVTLGRFVQLAVRHRATALADALARQLPVYAHRVQAAGIEDVATQTLTAGDEILVRGGELLPADGIVIAGSTEIDEALLTGESLPVTQRVGGQVAAGTLNLRDPIHVRVTAATHATRLSHIVALMQRTQAQKPALARAADAAAARFLSAVLIGAGLTCALWLLIDPTRAFGATLAVLVVACPCAFAIAMPAALSAAASALAKRGVLVTRMDAIEALARVDRIVLDKTGTLTRGEISVAHCVPLGDADIVQSQRIAAALESASEHPLARAFAHLGGSETATAVRSIAGAGIEGVVAGRRYRIGTADFVAGLRSVAALTGHHPASITIAILGDERQELALFELQDELRVSAPRAVERLRTLGITASILSGDAPEPVAAVARACGINEQVAHCGPGQKLAEVASLQRAGHRVAMVGDGVNDAPVLAVADVSIAMARGSALAQASADVILVAESLVALPEAIEIARRTVRVARQNLVWAAIYNLSALPLAALGYIPPWLAALGMSASSVAVMLNAMRLLPKTASRRVTSSAATTASPPTIVPAASILAGSP